MFALLAVLLAGCPQSEFSTAVQSRGADDDTEVAGQDWPNWRGPQHNGVSQETQWNSDWNDHPPKVLWKANVGVGFSSVSVAHGRLFTMGNRKLGADEIPHDVVSCLDATTGEVIWEHTYPCKFEDQYHEGGPGATPSVDGDRVYTFGRRGNFFCLSAEDGGVKWSKMLVDDLGIEPGEWGLTCSPLVLDKLVIVDAGRTVAYNKQSGEKRWQTKPYRHGYGSPVPIQHDDESLVTVFNNDALVVVDVADGAIVDEYPWETSFVTTSATPIVDGDQIYISSGYNTGCALLRLESGQLEEVYTSRLMRNHFNNSVLFRGTLFGMDGNSHSARNVQVVAADFQSGKVHWTQRGFGCGSLTIAGDKLLILSDAGELVVALTNPEKFQEVSRIKVLPGRCWTVPVLSHGRIYCRNAEGDLVCLDVAKQSSPKNRPN